MGHVQSESVCAQCEHCSLQEQNCGGESCPLPRALSGGRDYFLDSNDFISRLSGTQVSPSLLVLRTRANTNVIKMPPACQRAAVGGNAGRAQIFSQFALGIANPRFPSCKRGTAALFGKEKPNCTAPAPRQTRKERRRRSRSGVTIYFTPALREVSAAAVRRSTAVARFLVAMQMATPCKGERYSGELDRVWRHTAVQLCTVTEYS